MRIVKYVVGLLMSLALIAGACEGDDTSVGDSTSSAESATESDSSEAGTPPEDAAPEVDPPADEEFSGDGNGEFCLRARGFRENGPIVTSSPLDGPEFFDEVEQEWAEVLEIAPSEIKGEFETTLAGFRDMRALMEEFDYNVFDEGFAAGFGAMDTSEFDAAGVRIGAYLEEVCGIAQNSDQPGPGMIFPEGIDPEALENISPETVQGLFDQLGIDQETAECLAEEFGTDFDMENPDISLLTQEVCGTTLMEIITNLGPSE